MENTKKGYNRYKHIINQHIRERDFKKLFEYTDFELNKIFTKSFLLDLQMNTTNWRKNL